MRSGLPQVSVATDPAEMTSSPEFNRSAAVARTARKAASLLVQQDSRFAIPTRAMRDALLVGFAKRRRVLYGAAYDAVWCERPVDLTDPDAIASSFDAIRIYEVKSTGQKKIGSDLKGYFFNVTSAELLVAQALGEQFRFAFVSTVSETWQEMSVSELLGRAKAIYQAMHIRF